MSWIVLLIAGLLEVVWAIGLKYTHGFTRLTPSIITIAAMIVSIAMLLGNAHVACRNRLCGLDRYWRCWGGHYRDFAAG